MYGCPGKAWINETLVLLTESDTDTAPVRCCSHDGSKCDSYIPKQPTCHEAKTYNEAVKICKENQMRLCTVAELYGTGKQDGVCCTTGCWFDLHHIWANSDT